MGNQVINHTFEFSAMGCPCSIHLCALENSIDKLLKCAIQEIERFDKKYSNYKADSVVSKINQQRPMVTDQETAEILNYAATCFTASEGLFDITAGVYKNIWHKSRDDVPTDEEILQTKRYCGWDKVDWDGKQIHLPAGFYLDFGGVVKEYAADAVAQLLVNQGAFSCLVNLGGDIKIAHHPGHISTTWPVGISNPLHPNQPLHRIELTAGAVVTSGSYERYITIQGQQYSHLINPLTGWPAEEVLSVTVVSELAVVAGSLATIAALKPAELAINWLSSQNVPFIVVTQNKQVHTRLGALQSS